MTRDNKLRMWVVIGALGGYFIGRGDFELSFRRIKKGSN